MYMDDSALNALNGDNSTLCREASARRNQEVCPLCALADLKHSNLALISAVTHPSEQQTVQPGLLQHKIYSFIVLQVNKFSENYSKNFYIKISVINFFQQLTYYDINEQYHTSRQECYRAVYQHGCDSETGTVGLALYLTAHSHPQQRQNRPLPQDLLWVPWDPNPNETPYLDSCKPIAGDIIGTFKIGAF